MQASLFACYFTALIAQPTALIMSLLILWAGYLLFGLEPSTPRTGHEPKA